MKKIAYVSYEDKGTFASTVEDEDSVLFNFLKTKGLDIEKVIWDDEDVVWEDYSAAIVKSPWDYFEKFEKFLTWLDKIKSLGVKLLNPVDIIKWNSDKHYLAEIGSAGLGVIPTIYLEKDEKSSLSDFFIKLNADQFIIKPCVSGGSIDTFKVTKNNVDEIETKIHTLLLEKAFMVQPFIKEIETEGELSFLYFNGKFSHSLLKKAKEGDFRVQHYLGGTIHPQQPSAEILETINLYVSQFAKSCLYARVDGVMVNGEFKLMELELIEPFLFLFTNDKAYDNYYAALKELLKD